MESRASLAGELLGSRVASATTSSLRDRRSGVLRERCSLVAILASHRACMRGVVRGVVRGLAAVLLEFPAALQAAQSHAGDCRSGL